MRSKWKCGKLAIYGNKFKKVEIWTSSCVRVTHYSTFFYNGRAFIFFQNINISRITKAMLLHLSNTSKSDIERRLLIHTLQICNDLSKVFESYKKLQNVTNNYRGELLLSPSNSPSVSGNNQLVVVGYKKLYVVCHEI